MLQTSKNHKASAIRFWRESKERVSLGQGAGHGGPGFWGKETAVSRSLALLHLGKHDFPPPTVNSWANACKIAEQKSSSQHQILPNHPTEMGNDTILQRFLCSLGNHLILLVVCQFFLVLGNFTYRKGYSFRERGTRCWQLSQLAAVLRVAPRHTGIRGCALGHVTQNRQIFAPANLAASRPSSPSCQMLHGCVRAALPLWEVMRRG